MNRYNNFMNQNNYGWGNAVSDILGAVMQRNAQRGEEKKQANMYLDAANFGEGLNNLDMGGQTTLQDLGSRANPNSNYTNKTASTQAMQGLLPTSFNQTPTSDTLGQGLLGGLLPKQQVEQQPQRFFADPNIATDMQPATTPILGKYAKENNPAMVTTSAPKTLREQERMIRSQIPKAIKQYIDKGYKIDQILPLIKQTADDKIAELKSNNQDKVINDLYQGFISKEADANPNLKAMYAARLKQAGYDVTTAYKEFAPEYKFEKFDNGGTNEGYSFNPKTGKVERQLSMDKTISPDAQLNSDTRIKTTQMNNDTSKYTASLRGSGGKSGGGMTSTQQRALYDKLNNAKAIMSVYNPDGKQFTDQYGDEGFKPYSTAEQIRFNEAAEFIKAYDQNWGQSEPQPQAQGGNDDGAVWYDREYRNAINEGLTEEQATQYMSDIIKRNGG